METRPVWALPRLKGWSWWLFASAWSVLLAICLWSSAMVLPEIGRRVINPVSPHSAVGLTMLASAKGFRIDAMTAEASRTGLHKGDVIRLIDGRPAASDAHRLDAQLAGPAGARVTLTTVSPTGLRGRHVLTRDPRAYGTSLAAVGLSPTSLQLLTDGPRFIFEEVLLIVCASILMIKRSHDPLAPWASLMMLWEVLGDSNAGIWFTELFADPDMAYYITNGAAFSLLMVVLSVFPTGRFEPRWSLAVALVGVCATIISEPYPTAVSNLVLVVTQASAVTAIVARYRNLPAGPGRQQIRWAILGFAASVITLILLSLVQFASQATGSIGAAAWLHIAGAFLVSAVDGLLIVCLTLSLMRWRLYDADVTISRSVVYGALTLGLLAVFAGSEKLVELMGEQYLGERLGALAGALGAAAAAVCIVPLHHRVTHWAEKRFRSGLMRLRHGLPVLVGDMRETATPAALADAMLASVETGVRARHGAVIVGGVVLDVRDVEQDQVVAWLKRPGALNDDAETLRCDRSDPLFPVRLRLATDGNRLAGWLLLGPRPDGSFYGREERQALREIADPVARALAIAIQREQREADRRQRDTLLVQEVRALRQFMADKFGYDAGDGFVAFTP